MARSELEQLCALYANKQRPRYSESDCSIIDRVWRIYWNNQTTDLGTQAATWLLDRLLDKDSNRLVRSNVYLHFYHNRNSIPKKHRKWFRKTIKQVPKKKRKRLKIDAR